MFPFSPYNDFLCLVLHEAFLNKLLQLALQSLQQGRRAGPPLLFDWTSTALSERWLRALGPRISRRLFSFELASLTEATCIWSTSKKSTKETFRPLLLLTQLWVLWPSSQSNFKKHLKKLPASLSAAWDPTLERANADSHNAEVAPYISGVRCSSQASNFLMYKPTKCLGYFTGGNLSNFSNSRVRGNWL